MPTAILDNFHLGGVSDSIRSGIANSIPRLVGWDLHSNPGVITPAQKMSVIDGGVVTELCKVKVDCSNGIRYWFSSTSGKVWQEKNDVFTLVYTTVPTSGGASCSGAYEYYGYLYWATEKYLHRIDITLADGSSAWSTNAAPNWAAFTNGDADYHPMKDVNLVLYIGDGAGLAQIDSSTGDTTTSAFSGSALDIVPPHRVTCLAKQGTNILMGTIISTSVGRCSIYSWDGWSVSFTGEDEVLENGINCFIESDNLILVSAGLFGKLYTWDGTAATLYKRIPGTYSPTATCIIHPNAWGVLNGQILFGVSNDSGNPCDEGIWQIGRNSNSYPLVLDLPYPTSNVDGSNYPILSGITIGAILVSGNNVYMSWSYYNGTTTTYGIDKLDYSNKIKIAYLESRLISSATRFMRHWISDRDKLFTISNYKVPFQSMPSGCSLKIKASLNFGSFNAVDVGTMVIDNDANIGLLNTNARIEGSTAQIRLEAINSGNNASMIEQVMFDWQ